MNRLLGWLVPLGIIAAFVGCDAGSTAEPTAEQKDIMSKESGLTFVALSVPNMT